MAINMPLIAYNIILSIIILYYYYYYIIFYFNSYYCGVIKIPIYAVLNSCFQVYGYKSLVCLTNMEKAGFIRVQGQHTRIYPNLKKSLNLLVDDVNEQVETNSISAAGVRQYVPVHHCRHCCRARQI